MKPITLNKTNLRINRNHFKSEHSYNTAAMLAVALKLENLSPELRQALELRFGGGK